MTSTCPSCGADSPGAICNFCGSAMRTIESPEKEAEAIAELHVAIGDAEDDKKRARLLKNGPLPADTEVLIDAALRCTQLLIPANYSHETPNAALARLDSILIKLRLMDESPRSRRAISELNQRIERYKVDAAKEEREGGIIVGIMLLVILIGVLMYVSWPE